MLKGPAATASRVNLPRAASMSYTTSSGARQSGQPESGRLPNRRPHSLHFNSYAEQEYSITYLLWRRGNGILTTLIWGTCRKEKNGVQFSVRTAYSESHVPRFQERV